VATADVVVIGGGCTGTSTAFQLGRRGVRCVLLEKGQVGGGPTGRSSGIIRMHYSLEPLIRLARRSLEIFQHFADMVGGTADFRTTGFLLLAGAADRAHLEANARLQSSLGVRTSVLSPRALADLDPAMNLDDVAAAAYEPDSGYADGYATSTAFAAAARRHGVEVTPGATATRIVVERGVVQRVETSAGMIHAPRVLVAAGPWSSPLLDPLRVHLPIRTMRIQVALVHLRAVAIERVCGDLLKGFYLRPDVGGQVLLGSIEETDEEEVSADRFDEGLDFDFAERIVRKLVWRYPGSRDGEVRGGFASLYDVTPDWQPVLGPADGIDGLFVAAGFSGHGFKLSPAIGEVMAQTVLGERSSIDIGVFRPSRFADGALIRSPYAYGIIG